jgi:acetyltransferase-like isoleucine patch superfamily enzyme
MWQRLLRPTPNELRLTAPAPLQEAIDALAADGEAFPDARAFVTAGSVVEDDVFIGPGAVTTNDDTMGRHDGSIGLVGATLRRACRIGGGAVILPGVEVGEEAMVGGGAVVRDDVAPRTVVVGVPARVIRAVRDDELLEHWR